MSSCEGLTNPYALLTPVPDPPRGFSVTDILESSEIEDPLVAEHPSALLPPASHEPLTMRNVALRSDQIGWDNTDVRTNQCVVGVTFLREEALALTQAYNLAQRAEPEDP